MKKVKVIAEPTGHGKTVSFDDLHRLAVKLKNLPKIEIIEEDRFQDIFKSTE